MIVNGHWVHNLDPFLLRLWDGFGIRWYGLAYLLAFGAGYWLLGDLRRRGRSPLSAEQESEAVLAWIAGILIGGRVGYFLLYAGGEFLRDPLALLRIWEGGMSSHGGFAGVILATAWIARRFRIRFLRLGDVISLLAPPGLFLVRVANFINGELWGKPASLPWAVIFPHSAPAGTPLEQIAPRHPSQLYEALLEGLCLFVYTQWRLRRTQVLEHPGRLSGEFLMLYALARILGEQFREPDASLVWGFSRGVFYSFFLALLGAVLLARSCVLRRRESPGQKRM